MPPACGCASREAAAPVSRVAVAQTLRLLHAAHVHPVLVRRFGQQRLAQAVRGAVAPGVERRLCARFGATACACARVCAGACTASRPARDSPGADGA
eukprot:130876-Pleurochrysis_carterae.AAC.2